ncbi:MAG: hypothetical protein JST12_14785 [Armatimonadetes bacterium]|nr:hypothetical protein [Armatimonadota bacterium]
MKRLVLVVATLLAAICCGQVGSLPAPIGGNIGVIRPAHVAQDFPAVVDAASFIASGAEVRVDPALHECDWGPSTPFDFRSVDAFVSVIKAHKFRSIWPVALCPHPSSLWHAGPDWWMPDASVWPKLIDVEKEYVQHVEDALRSSGCSPPTWEIWNEGDGLALNPPMPVKPGGSSSTQFGEWDPRLHKLLKLETTMLRSIGIPTSRIATPALSAFRESREAPALLSAIPPKDSDWLSDCGVVQIHALFTASYATTFDQAKAGFSSCLDRIDFLVSHMPGYAGKSVLASEVYVTPYGCGRLPIDADLTAYRRLAVDLMRSKRWRICVWGLLPDPPSVTDPGSRYGPWGPSIMSIENRVVKESLTPAKIGSGGSGGGREVSEASCDWDNLVGRSGYRAPAHQPARPPTLHLLRVHDLDCRSDLPLPRFDGVHRI